jgi:hypothetical protein
LSLVQIYVLLKKYKNEDKTKVSAYENVLQRLYYDTIEDKLVKFDHYKKIYIPNINCDKQYNNIKDVDIILMFKKVTSFELDISKEKLTNDIDEDSVKKHTKEEKEFLLKNKSLDERELDEISVDEKELDDLEELDDFDDDIVSDKIHHDETDN